ERQVTVGITIHFPFPNLSLHDLIPSTSTHVCHRPGRQPYDGREEEKEEERDKDRHISLNQVFAFDFAHCFSETSTQLSGREGYNAGPVFSETLCCIWTRIFYVNLFLLV